MTFDVKLKEERAEGRAEGLVKGRTEEIFTSVAEGDYPPIQRC